MDNQYQNQYQNQNQYQMPQQPQPQGDGLDYTPISMWGYFGYELLFSIPCIGFIVLLVFAFGGTKNINLRNFARSYFCFLIVAVIISIIFFILGGAALMTSLAGASMYY